MKLCPEGALQRKPGGEYAEFYWQQGYGMFFVGPTRVEDITGYIEQQRDHHRRQTFQDQFRAFLNRYGIEYDERYLWE